jgi:hypothetical protein
MYAQHPQGSIFARLGSDSVAWQRVLGYVVGALSSEMLTEAIDQRPQPWQLRLPSNEPQRALLETQLRTILRARPVTSNDTVFHSLDIGPLTIVHDTARVEVRMNETRRCSGSSRTTASGWITTVLVRRDPLHKFWGAAFSRSTLAGDSLGC